MAKHPDSLISGCFLLTSSPIRINMKRLHTLLISLVILALPMGAQAEDAPAAMQRIGKEVAALNLGFGDYVLGKRLSKEQQDLAKNNRIAKSVAGTTKFQDGEIFIIAQDDTFMVLGIYKQYSDATRQQVKSVVGDLMLRFNEPTTMAHDKLIYWAFSKDGHIPQDEFDLAKKSGDTEIIATVKFSSSNSIFPDPDPKKKEQMKADEKQTSDIYVMITSDPLSKIFLALN